MNKKISITERLHAAASRLNLESELDQIMNEAGLTWECYEGRDSNSGFSHWTNGEEDKKCERCGRKRPKVPADG